MALVNEVLERLDQPTDSNQRPLQLTLDTKYYTATLELHLLSTLDDSETVGGVVCLLDDKEWKQDKDGVISRLELIEKHCSIHETQIAIVVIDSFDSDELQSQCLDRGFQLIIWHPGQIDTLSIRAHTTLLSSNADDEKPLVGIDCLIEALETNIWDSVTLKTHTRTNDPDVISQQDLQKAMLLKDELFGYNSDDECGFEHMLDKIQSLRCKPNSYY